LARRQLSFLAIVTQPTALLANPDAVLLDLRANTGEAAIRELQALLGAAGGAVSEPPKFLADLLERAEIASVCIAADVALPHARTSAVGRMVLAVGRAAHGIAFDAEHPQVRLVFLIGTPKNAAADYLQLVASLSRLLKNPLVRQGLLTARTTAEFIALLASGAEAKR
jgi:mannitol/fructose-specific phosphotransferase system IIA component (Ntr-type)